MDKVYNKVRLKISRFSLIVFTLFLMGSALKAETPGKGGWVTWMKAVSPEFSKSGQPTMIQGITGEKAGLADLAGSFSFSQPLVGGLAASPTSTGLPPVSVNIEKGSLLQTLTIVSLVLIAIILLLAFISANLANLIRMREGKEPMTLGSLMSNTWQMLLNPYYNGVAMLTAVIIGLFIIVPIARGVGHHEGYMPEQPIKFSHKIHAGDNQIDCQYCHIGASRGKYATIPSTNICMNCHQAIREGKRWGSTEIGKVVAAWEQKKPIEWVRIHNLPDLAYFNHQQHVVVGKQQCQTCHGPVQEIDYPMYQFNRLSMGWCVNCHRETQVDAELYKKMGIESKDPKNHPLKVKDIGGLDCVRCHY